MALNQVMAHSLIHHLATTMAMFEDDMGFDVGSAPETPQIPRSSSSSGYKNPHLCKKPDCPLVKKDKSKWCNAHDRILANRIEAARRESTDQEKATKAYLKDEANCLKVLDEDSGNTIGSNKFGRKPPVQWAEWNEKHGIKVKLEAGTERQPYEKKQYCLRLMNKFGREEAEAEEEWNWWTKSGVKHDYRGKNGQIRLWLTKKEFELDSKERYQTGEVAAGSHRIKEPDEQTMQALQQHTRDKKWSTSDAFFQNRDAPNPNDEGPSASTPSKSQPDTSPQKRHEEEQMKSDKKKKKVIADLNESDSEEPARKIPRKTKPLSSRMATFQVQASKELANLNDKFGLMHVKAKEALEKGASPACEPSTTFDIKARGLYKDFLVKRCNVMKVLFDAEMTDTVEGYAAVDGKIPVTSDNVQDVIKVITKNRVSDLGLTNPTHILPIRAFDTLLSEVSQLTGAPEEDKTFEKKKLVWGRMNTCMLEFLASVKSAVGDLVKHSSQLEKTKERDRAKKEATEAMEMMRQHQQDCTAKAASVAVGQPILQPFACFGHTLSLYAVVPTQFADADTPWIFSAAENDAFKKWQSDAAIGKLITSFGSKYKKEDQYAAQKKVSCPMAAKQGKEPSNEMFDSLIAKLGQPAADLKSISSTWGESCWLWGYSENYQQAGLTPNSSAMLRTLSFGKIDAVLIETTKLVAAMKDLAVKDISSKTVFPYVQDLTAGQLVQLKAKGALVYKVEQKQGEGLYVPSGWVLVEKSHSSEKLIFGARKSFFLQGGRGLANYDACRDLLSKGGSPNTGRMEEISKLLAP